MAKDGVTTPGEITDSDLRVSEGKSEPRFKGSIPLLALDNGVSDEHDAVAILEFESGFLRWLGGWRGDVLRAGDANDGEEENGEFH